ncbi:DUF2529 family protein [Salipaludibacillus sp. CF4.18]|uniref:DUF2529 family protein n=1 Tax=Salipaludibacillus sp. CF4.18 TaxID=3373081 RepID=UPI003EE44748
MKIFDTQVKGLVNKLIDYEEELEDAARVMAQSIVSDGHLYWTGEKEMDGIITQACFGTDGLSGSKRWSKEITLSEMDTLVIVSPSKHSSWANDVIDIVKDSSVSIIAIYSHETIEENSDQSQTWIDTCDFAFFTGVDKGLVPMESGARIGNPHLLIALQIYYQLYFAVAEMLEEHE